MAEETRNQIKTYFQTGDIPTQDEFGNLIDSMINKKDDGITIIPDVTGNTTQVGINNTAPHCPLAIRSNTSNNAICLTSYTPGSEFHLSVNPSPNSTTVYNGLDINEGGTGLGTSRLFIEKGTGFVGVGTTDPSARVHLKDASIDTATAVKIENAQVGLNPLAALNKAWQLGHIHDSGFAERNGAFSVMEETSATDLNERITVLPGKNTGINHPLPVTVLHVYGNPAVDESKIQLLAGTGIVTIGPADGTNLVLDFNAIQAQQGTAANNTESAVTLNLQPLGGDMIVHGELVAERKFIVKESGSVGIGTDTPGEKLQVNGAVVVGNTSNTTPAEGTIRYNPATADLEGYVSGLWASLTGTVGGGGFWQSAGTDKIRYNTTDAKVAIGIETPTATLHVSNNTNLIEGNSVTSLVENTAILSSEIASGDRFGIVVKNSLQWSSSATAKNIGIAVQSAGMPNAHQNIAALLSGNVVIGKQTAEVIGNGGNNVLAIQNGEVPATAVGASDDGIQIYSADRSETTISTFHVMNGDGTVLRLYRQAAGMTAANTSTPDSGSVTTDTLITNMRTRINELETILKNLGVLA